MAAARTGGDRVLTERELNRALLARQGLLGGHRGSVPAVLDKIGGIQAQYAPAMYVGLLARMQRLEREDVTRSLERRSTVQGTLLRSTIHLVSKADYWPTALAIRRPRQDWQLRAVRGGPSEAECRRSADVLRTALADGPLRRKEIDLLVGKPWSSYVGLWVDLVRVPPSGTWDRRSADLYGLAEDWVGPQTGTEDEGGDLLVRRYLCGFGPARVADIVSWAQLPAATVTAALARTDTRSFRDERGKVLVDLPRLALPEAETPAPVRFLPTWDATLLVHARRTQILPEEHRSKVFSTKRPHSIGTFLVDGRVAGSWRPDGGRIVTEEFAPLDPADRRAVAAEAERLEAFHA